METKKIYLLFSGILSVFVLSGCQKPILLYDGPKLPKRKIAILHGDYCYNDYPYTIPGPYVYAMPCNKFDYLIIDGKDLTNYIDESFDLHMLPGKHEIKWAWKNTNANFTYEGHGTLNARAGNKYSFVFVFIKGKQLSESNGGPYGTGEYKVVKYLTFIISKKDNDNEDWTSY